MNLRGIDYTQIPQVPALFRDYVHDFDRVRAFFAGDSRAVEDHLEEAERLARRDYDRATLHDVLTRENRRLGADRKALDQLDRLGSNRTFTVVTGQQAGIYTGPVYTLYKALTAIRLADELDRAAGERFDFIPLFWCAAEDHDIEEIHHLHVATADGPRKLTAPIAAAGSAAGDTFIDEGIDAFVDQLTEVLPASEFRERVLSNMSPRHGESLADWFCRSLLWMLRDTGLAVVDPRWLRPLAAPVFERFIDEHARIDERLAATQDDLERKGYEPILGRGGAAHLFETIEGRRTRTHFDGDRWITEGTAASRGLDEARELIREDPTRFSTDVVARPMVQSHVLPVTTFVGGPSEVAYFAELHGVFDHLDIPMPRVVPRISATLITRRTEKSIDSFGLTAAALFEMAEAPPTVDELPADVLALLDGLARVSDDTLPALGAAVARVDGGARKTVDKSADQIRQRIDKIDRAVRDAHARAAGLGRERWQRLRDEVLPKGRLQERTYGTLSFLVRHGERLPAELLAALDPLDFRHQLVTLGPSAPENAS